MKIVLATCGSRGDVQPMIVPYILEQCFHGQQIYLSDMGAKPVWRNRLTADKLTAALKTVLFSNKIKQKAKISGREIDKTRSLELIVKAVEQPVGNDIT